MNQTNTFPLPFKSLRNMSGGKEGPYVIGAMFTAAYSQKAERLAASCEKFCLPYVIHEVPAVHRSINARLGTEDLSFTKANFIHHLLAAHGKPVLYLDVDCEFVSEPDLVGNLARSGCDFAIYNWLADEYSDRFVPLQLTILGDETPIRNRFYRFMGRVDASDLFTTSQLLCSGLVQFYGNSDAARFLLSEWQHTIATFPGGSDDGCLSFTFNNLGGRSEALKVQWLPKAYARIAWWIYAKPVINHRDIPQQPDSHFIEINDPTGRKLFYPSLAEERNVVRLFPRDCIIDTERHVVCKLVGDQLVPIKLTDQSFWL